MTRIGITMTPETSVVLFPTLCACVCVLGKDSHDSTRRDGAVYVVCVALCCPDQSCFADIIEKPIHFNDPDLKQSTINRIQNFIMPIKS